MWESLEGGKEGRNVIKFKKILLLDKVVCFYLVVLVLIINCYV